VFDSRRSGPAADLVGEATLECARATGLLLWARVAVTSYGREVDALSSGSRAWAPVHVPAPFGGRVRVALSRRTSDDGVHPDYELFVDGASVWLSPHHVDAARAP